MKAILQYNFKFFKFDNINKGKAEFEMQTAEKVGPSRGKIFVGGRWKLRIAIRGVPALIFKYFC